MNAFYSLHMLVLRYAGECKQYGADLFAVVLLLYLYYTYKPNKWTRAIIWAVVGSLMLWLSMPSVFVLAGIGLAWPVELITNSRAVKINDTQTKKEPPQLDTSILKLGVVALVWLGAVAVNYHFILAPGLASGHMQDYHAQYFLDITSIESVQKSLLTFIRLIAKKSAVGIAAAVILLLAGIWSLRKRSECIVLLLPILLALLFSALGMYSLLERLILFALPLLLMMAGYGLLAILNIRMRPILKNVILLVLLIGILIAFSNRQGTKLIAIHPMEDLKSALVKMPHDINKPIYTSRHAYPTYHHYTEIDKIISENNIILGSQLSNISTEIKTLIRAKEFWIILSHIDNMNAEKQGIMDSFEILKIYEAKGSMIFKVRTRT